MYHIVWTHAIGKIRKNYFHYFPHSENAIILTMKNVAFLVLRSIGALTIPFVVLAAVVAVGNFSARCPTPWREGSSDCPDGLTLMGASFVGGIMFLLSAYGIAAKWKKVMATSVILIFLVWSISAMLLVPEATDGFGIFRLCVTFLGMVVGCVVVWKKDCK